MDNKLKIINYLGKHLGQLFTMHGLSKFTKIPYATFYRIVHDMKDLVNMQKVGKSITIALNDKNPTIKSYLTISSDEEKKEFLRKHPLINKIVPELKAGESILLFGSYAKGNERDNSDIDLLIINKKGNKSISFSKYEILFKKKINPIFITRKELKQMLSEKKENVGKQTLKSHIILNNPDLFWECVLNGRL